MFGAHLLRALESGDTKNRGGQAVPFFRLYLHLLYSQASQRVKFGAAIIFRRLPFCLDPALLLQFMQSGIKGSVAYLELVIGNLSQAAAYGPAVQWLEGENLQNQEIQGALDQVGWFA